MGERSDVDQGLTRRHLLAGASAVALVSALAGQEQASGEAERSLPLGPEPAGLPAGQHLWTGTLQRDAAGNPVSPRFDRLLFFDVRGRAAPSHARILESALRALERRFAWGPHGLLLAAGWGAHYFERHIGASSPVPGAEAMAPGEHPALDAYDLCLHLACDDERRLAEVERALVDGAPLPGVRGRLDLASALVWRETRTGFAGAGLPAAHQDVGGIPRNRPVSPESPLYMGFISSRARNQASEEDITIRGGQFAGGTTMHVSYIRLALDEWYGRMSKRERVARMYAPQVSPAQAAAFTTDALSDPGGLAHAARRYGMVGHAQAVGQARRSGRPRILRRDFDSADGGQAGVHFVSLQRSIEDFVSTRRAMNAASVQRENRGITQTARNGINDFLSVRRRGNYIVPPREQRSFPLLPGRAAALRG
jgi:hypothetical protein